MTGRVGTGGGTDGRDGPGCRRPPCGCRTLCLLLLMAAGAWGCGESGEVEVRLPPLDVVPRAPFQLIQVSDARATFAETRLGMASPEEGAAIAEGDTVQVAFTLSGFDLGVPTPGSGERGLTLAAEGQHIRLLVGDRQEVVVTDLDEPVTLADLPPGTHHLRAVPVTEWYESVKTPGAFVHRVIHVGEGEDSPRLDDGAVLTPIRPWGEYRGARADSILVDVHLTGVRLSDDGIRLRLTVEGLGRAEITRWAPHVMVGLPDGVHRVRLELVDDEGRRLPGPLTRAERVITVDRRR